MLAHNYIVTMTAAATLLLATCVNETSVPCIHMYGSHAALNTNDVRNFTVGTSKVWKLQADCEWNNPDSQDDQQLCPGAHLA